MYTITQKETTILSSDCKSLKMIFNNLSGRNIKGLEYRRYLADMKERSDLIEGQIEFRENGEILEVSTIK